MFPPEIPIFHPNEPFYAAQIDTNQTPPDVRPLQRADRRRPREARRPPQMLYQTHYYYLLSEEFGYDVKYISAILNRLKREEESGRGI